MGAGLATGRNSRVRVFRAALPCLALIAFAGTAAQAQTVTPDLFSSRRTSQTTPADSPLRRTAAEANDPLNSPKLQDNKDRPAHVRLNAVIGDIRDGYGLPARGGAAASHSSMPVARWKAYSRSVKTPTATTSTASTFATRTCIAVDRRASNPSDRAASASAAAELDAE